MNATLNITNAGSRSHELPLLNQLGSQLLQVKSHHLLNNQFIHLTNYQEASILLGSGLAKMITRLCHSQGLST